MFNEKFLEILATILRTSNEYFLEIWSKILKNFYKNFDASKLRGMSKK